MARLSQELPLNKMSSRKQKFKVRQRNRCPQCGRPRAVSILCTARWLSRISGKHAWWKWKTMIRERWPARD